MICRVVIEEAALFAEEFFNTPFPTTDIIGLLVVPSPGNEFLDGGRYEGSHFWVVRRADIIHGNIHHETAHYYAHGSFGPRWLREGTADLVKASIMDRNGIQPLVQRQAEIQREVDKICRAVAGIQNIHELNNAP